MDVVDASNLQRQILHNLDRIGDRKVDSAKKTLTAMNPDVNVVTYDVRLGADNILEVIDGYDVIVDGTDNFPTRYLVNDAALLKRIPVVHGSIFRFEGQATVFYPYQGPCYRCLVPEPPPAELAPSCAEAGVLGRPAGHHRLDPGRRGDQAPAQARRSPRRPPTRLRRPRAVVPDLQGPAGPGLPRLRGARRRDRHRGVRRPVHAAPQSAGASSLVGWSPASRRWPRQRLTLRRWRATTASAGLTPASRSAAVITASDLNGFDPDAAARRAGRLPLHAGRPAGHVPRPALDDAPVRRVRDGGGDERAVQVPPGSRADRAVLRLRPADPDGLRLRSSPRRGRGRQGGRRDRLDRRHAHPRRRPPARPACRPR